MPLDAAIPLSFQPTTKLIDPMTVQQHAMEIRNARQRNVLGQQQIDAVGLENQKRQHDLDAERDLAELSRANTEQGPDGQLHVNHAAIVNGMMGKGHTALAIKLDADHRANEMAGITNMRNQLSAAQEKLKLSGQLLGPLVNAAPDTPLPHLQQLWKDAHGRALQAGLIKQGEEPEELPLDAAGKPDLTIPKAHYQAAMDANQQADQYHKQLEWARKLVDDGAKSAKDWREITFGMASAADSPEHLEGIKRYLKYNHAPDEVLALIPAFSPTFQADMTRAAISPEQRIDLPGKLAKNETEEATNFSRKTEGATSYGEYNTLRNGAGPIGSQFPDYSQADPSAPIADEDRSTVRHLGMTPAQGAIADSRDERVEMERDRLKRENNLMRREKISTLADQAIEHSNNGGGTGVDDAIKNVSNTGYYQNHPIGNARGEVLAELQRRKINGAGGLSEQSRQLTIDAKTKEQEMTDTLMGKTPKSAGGRGPTPGRPTTPTASPKPATPTPAPAPRAATAPAPNAPGHITIRTGDGKTRVFTDEAAAKRFEDLVKQHNGTSQRVAQ